MALSHFAARHFGAKHLAILAHASDAPPAEETPRAGGGPGRRYFPRLAPSLAEIDDDDLGVLIASRPLH